MRKLHRQRRAIYLLGGEVKDIYKFDLFDQKRSFVVIERSGRRRKLIQEKPAHRQKNRCSNKKEIMRWILDPVGVISL